MCEFPNTTSFREEVGNPTAEPICALQSFSSQFAQGIIYVMNSMGAKDVVNVPISHQYGLANQILVPITLPVLT